MKRLIYIFVICFALMTGNQLFAADFEELDKPPEGVYRGQILTGGFFSFGVPSGSVIDAEKSFVKGSTYTFVDSETTKALWITHLSYSYGVYGEYIVYEHIGVYAQFGGVSVVQRSDFGRNYSNKRKYLYSGVMLLLGPNFHLTDRRPWDLSLAPLIGYTYGTFNATPVADSLISGYDPSNARTKISTFVYGANLKGTIYFSGGFSISLGGEWIRIPIKLSGPIAEKNPQTGIQYMNGKSSGNIDNLRLIVSAGYAFKH
ncbi:MAG TPA: hypothetical protein VF857_07510 [Spirochaetota bacterium]